MDNEACESKNGNWKSNNGFDGGKNLSMKTPLEAPQVSGRLGHLIVHFIYSLCGKCHDKSQVIVA